MPTRHLTIEVPRVLARHNLGKSLGNTLGPDWEVGEVSLVPKPIVEKAIGVRIDLRRWRSGQELRVHTVIQTMRLVVRSGTTEEERLAPLVFMAAMDREGAFACEILGDFHALPDETKRTLERAKVMFSGNRENESPYQSELVAAEKMILRTVNAAGWFNPALQRLWLDSKLL